MTRTLWPLGGDIVSPTFALHGHFPELRGVSLLPATWIFEKPLGEDLPPFHALGFLPCCCFPCFCAAPTATRTARTTATSASWRIGDYRSTRRCNGRFCIWARSTTSNRPRG